MPPFKNKSTEIFIASHCIFTNDPIKSQLIYTKLIDKMEIKSRINLSTHVSMCTKKKKKNQT